MFGGGGQVGTDDAELGGAGEGAQTTGDFLPDLDHPDLALGCVPFVVGSCGSGSNRAGGGDLERLRTAGRNG